MIYSLLSAGHISCACNSAQYVYPAINPTKLFLNIITVPAVMVIVIHLSSADLLDREECGNKLLDSSAVRLL